MAERPKYYWDACAWIALIQQEPGRFDSLRYLIEEARQRRIEIWTSNFTLAEVYKRPCDDEQKGLLLVQDRTFEDFLVQSFVQRVQVDFDVGTLAPACCGSIPLSRSPKTGFIWPRRF